MAILAYVRTAPSHFPNVLAIRMRGTGAAQDVSVGARSFKELDCWRLANELKVRIYELIRKEAVKKDLEFRNQIRHAAASAPRNIAEGFGRYLPREFAQYLRVANGSLMETSNHLEDGRDRGYFTDAEIEEPLLLARRASGASTKLLRYLQSAPDPRTSERTNEPPGNPRTKEPKNRNPIT